MAKQPKKFTKEWIEFTLCDMLDDILLIIKKGENKTEIMEIIKKYSGEIYNSQSYDRK